MQGKGERGNVYYKHETVMYTCATYITSAFVCFAVAFKCILLARVKPMYNAYSIMYKVYHKLVIIQLWYKNIRYLCDIK